jgi:hypothetical protein
VKKLLIAASIASFSVTSLCLNPSVSQARLGSTVEELKNEAIMKQFAIKALIKTAVSQARIYELTPLGTSVDGKVKLKLRFDANERLTSAELLLSQAYVKEDPSGAKYYAAWFMRSQIPLQDTAAILSLSKEVEYRNDNPNYHILGEQPVLPAKPTAGYQAIIGKGTYNLPMKKSKISITQIKNQGNWTSIRIDPK